MIRRLARLCCAAVLLASAPAGGQPAAPRRTVAVLYFDNYTGKVDYDPLGKGIASMMISDLGVVPEIQLLERDRIQDLLKESELSRTRYFDSTTAVKLGRLSGAEYIVVGAFASVQPQMRIDTRVVRVGTGEIVKTAQVVGREDAFFDLEQQLAARLIDGLGIALSPESKEKLRAKQESNRIDAASTVVAFSKALSLYDKGEYVDAGSAMAPALRASPNSELVQGLYGEIRRRAAAKAASTARDRIKAGIGGFLKRP
jgi:curli biogenesis system outer membrane secretion channel CsgG